MGRYYKILSNKKINYDWNNVEEVEELTSKFHIRNIPATFIFKGGEVVDKLIGTYSESELKEKIKKFI